MDGEFRGGCATERGPRPSIRGRRDALRTECWPDGDVEDVMCRERGLRRVTQAEHGKAVIAPDEADGEHGAG